MINQILTWTACPNGYSPDGTMLRLSVAMSPRLYDTGIAGDTVLGNYPDFLTWPSIPITFAVAVGPADPAPVTITSPARVAARWTELFNATTVVQPYAYSSPSGQRFHSYPTDYLRAWHVATYANLANTSPTDYPTLAQLGLLPSSLAAPYGALPVTDEQAKEAIGEVNQLLDEGYQNPTGGGPTVFAIPPATAPAPLTDFEQAELFLQPLTTYPAPATYETTPKPTIPEIDFHQMISTLGNYPYLQRLLGLVWDLEVPVPSGMATVVPVSVTPTWGPLLAATTNVVVATEALSATFLAEARAANPEIANGYLRMSDPCFLAPGQPGYPVLELEVDGSTLKTLNFARGVYRAVSSWATAATPTSFALPALRSAGLGVARTGLALDFGTALQNTDALNGDVEADSPVTVYAEDVTRGFRIDVWDSVTDLWHQLCARVSAPSPGGYAFGIYPHRSIVPVPAGEEGWVQLGLTAGPQGGNNDSYLSELLLRWTGWSLIATRPGKHLDDAPDNALQAPQNNPPSTAFPLAVSFAAAPGTLPVLRYGWSYRFRARSVDLAGNSVPFDDAATAASFDWATGELLYGRMEPVPSPPVVPHDPRLPGDHLERIVIRSEFYDTPDDDADVTPSQRHIVPPSTTEQMAEEHGMVDTPAHAPDPTLYPTLAASANQTFTTAASIAANDGVQDPTALDQYYFPVDELTIPYLPDVFARGAVLQSVPGLPTPFQYPFGNPANPWPQTSGFRLLVHAGNQPPVPPSPGNNYALEVWIEKATFTTMRLSCYMQLNDVLSMGLWEWLNEAGLATPALQELAASGQHYMFTPYREVTLVHAVRQPLTIPQFTSPSAYRDLGKTFAYLNDTVQVDFQSSQKLDLYAQWEEPFDDGVNPIGAVYLQGNAPVDNVPLELFDPAPTSILISNSGPPGTPTWRHDFGDTKYRLVYYEAQSTTRFLEYFLENVEVTLTDANPTTVDPGGMATGTVVVTAVNGSNTVYEDTIDYTEDDAAGTITAIEGGGIIPIAGGSVSVSVAYVPPPVTRSSLEEIVSPATAEGYPVIVPSTDRPPAPDVRYVLPLFSFSDSETTSPYTITSTRTGNALRVYLGRPWFASGDGELLGVIVAQDYTKLATQFEPFATRYGTDPLFATNPVDPAPAWTDYLLAVEETLGVTLPESDTATTWDVAGHTVSFDTTHQLWYADIEIDTAALLASGGGPFDTYWPFIRLCLVRYQPNSLGGVECSSVVQVDAIKVATDRMATLTFPALNQVTITLTGVDYLEGPAPEQGQSAVTATVQQLVAGVTDADLMWQNVEGFSIALTSAIALGDTVTWSGTLSLPQDYTDQSFRIQLEEYELIPTENSSPTGGPPGTAVRVTYINTLQIS